MATLEEEYKKYQGEGYDQINSMYDAQKQATLSGLEQAYNQNLSSAEAARDQTGQQYQARANDLGAQYERNRRNLNEQAAANGLNTGTGSQMQLALNNNYMKGYGQVRTAEQQALDEANRGIENLKASYQSSVQQAVADNDYQRAQALLGEYQRQYQQKLQQAQQRASYGDFSAYLNIPGYDQASVDSMRNAWIASNPDLAYNTGAINADQYYAMTGWHSPYEQQQQALGYEQQQQAYSNLYSLIASTGYRPSDEELAAAGMSRGAADALANYFAAYGTGGSSGTRRSTGGSGGNGGNGGNGGTDGDGENGTKLKTGDGGRTFADNPLYEIGNGGSNGSVLSQAAAALAGIPANGSGPTGAGANIENAIYQIGTSRNPDEEMNALINSPYFDRMTEDQKQRLALAYQHATRTGRYAPHTQQSPAQENPLLRVGDPGYYIDPSLRTEQTGRARMAGESNRSALMK